MLSLGIVANASACFITVATPFSGDVVASFHRIRRGSYRLESNGMMEHLLHGDLVFLVSGRAHLLSSEPSNKHAANQIADTLLLCG